MIEIIVGNVGTVYSGSNAELAYAMFEAYVHQSNLRIGRAAGEPVTWMENGEITKEHAPRMEA